MTVVRRGDATLWLGGEPRRVADFDVTEGPGGCVRLEVSLVGLQTYNGEATQVCEVDILLFELEPQAAADLANALGKQVALAGGCL